MAYYSDIGWPNIVEILTTHRGDVGILIFEEGNDIPLILAKSQSNVATANLLVSHHTNLGTRSSRFIASYMAGKVLRRFCEAANKLLYRCQTEYAETALHIAISSGNESIVKLLNDYKVNIATGDEDG